MQLMSLAAQPMPPPPDGADAGNDDDDEYIDVGVKPADEYIATLPAASGGMPAPTKNPFATKAAAEAKALSPRSIATNPFAAFTELSQDSSTDDPPAALPTLPATAQPTKLEQAPTNEEIAKWNPFGSGPKPARPRSDCGQPPAPPARPSLASNPPEPPARPSLANAPPAPAPPPRPSQATNPFDSPSPAPESEPLSQPSPPAPELLNNPFAIPVWTVAKVPSKPELPARQWNTAKTDKIGFDLQAADTVFSGPRVSIVYPGPAKEQGVHVGDTIAAVSGKNTHGRIKASLVAMLSMLRSWVFQFEAAGSAVGHVIYGYEVCSQQPWYWVPCLKEEATKFLAHPGQPVGGFVVRDAKEFGHHILTLKDEDKTVAHVRVTRDGKTGHHCIEKGFADGIIINRRITARTLDDLIGLLKRDSTAMDSAEGGAMVLKPAAAGRPCSLPSFLLNVDAVQGEQIDALEDEDNERAGLNHLDLSDFQDGIYDNHAGEDSGSDYDESTLDYEDPDAAMEPTYEDPVQVAQGVQGEPPTRGSFMLPQTKRRFSMHGTELPYMRDAAVEEAHVHDPLPPVPTQPSQDPLPPVPTQPSQDPPSDDLPSLPFALHSREETEAAAPVMNGLATLPRLSRPTVGDLPDLASALGLTQSRASAPSAIARSPDPALSMAATPFLCDALVDKSHHFYFKTNHACTLSIGEFTIKDARGKDVLIVADKLKFKKTKQMTVEFLPQMANVWFTPGLGRKGFGACVRVRARVYISYAAVSWNMRLPACRPACLSHTLAY